MEYKNRKGVLSRFLQKIFYLLHFSPISGRKGAGKSFSAAFFQKKAKQEEKEISNAKRKRNVCYTQYNRIRLKKRKNRFPLYPVTPGPVKNPGIGEKLLQESE